MTIGPGAAERACDLFHAAEIFCGFGVIEEVNGAAFRKPQRALNGFSYGAPDFGG
jgi:hypothetical protein